MSRYVNLSVDKLHVPLSAQIDGPLFVGGALSAANVVVPSSALAGSTLGVPSAGTLSVAHENTGLVNRSTFTLTGARIPVTDGAGAGSYGTLPLLTMPGGFVNILGCRQKYTAFSEGAALTTGAGHAAHVLGVGSAAIAAAADGALATTSNDVGSSTGTITNSGGTGTATKANVGGVVIDGSSSPAILHLNWSGTAATIDASSYINVTGVIVVEWSFI